MGAVSGRLKNNLNRTISLQCEGMLISIPSCRWVVNDEKILDCVPFVLKAVDLMYTCNITTKISGNGVLVTVC